MRRIALYLPTLLLAAHFVAGSPNAGGACATDGWCHLPTWVPAGASPLDATGTSVVIEGARAAVASPGAGIVTTYERIDGVWVEGEQLLAPPTSAGGFGSSLALHGDRLVVGDPSDAAVAVGAGAAHLYEHVGGSWLLEATLTDPEGAADDLLGTAVDATDVFVLAGAPGDHDGGRVHLFRHDASWTWAGSIRDFASGTTPEAFGSALSMDGEWLMVGDPLSDTHAADTGAVLTFEVFEIFAFYQDLSIPPVLEAGDHFGSSIDFDGERMLVGAPGDDGSGPDAGAAYLFSFDEIEVAGHELHELAEWAACGASGGDLFGTSVGLDGERAIVGAPHKGPVGHPAGRAQVFAREPGVAPETWSLDAELALTGGAVDDLFGAAVAIWGTLALVGSPGADGAGAESGAGHLVSLTSDLLPGGECPCSTLAGAETFGLGKPGSAGVPTLSVDQAPVPGEPSVVQLGSALPGATPVLLWGTTPAVLPFDGGELYIADPHLEFLPVIDAAGASADAWNVPANPGLCGTQVVLQALFVDPAAAGALHTAQSPGLTLRLGY